MSKHLTIVFEIEDADAFAEERSGLIDRMRNDGPVINGARVTAVSLDHEIRRLEFMEAAADAREDELDCVIGQIASATNIGDKSDYQQILDEAP